MRRDSNRNGEIILTVSGNWMNRTNLSPPYVNEWQTRVLVVSAIPINGDGQTDSSELEKTISRNAKA